MLVKTFKVIYSIVPYIFFAESLMYSSSFFTRRQSAAVGGVEQDRAVLSLLNAEIPASYQEEEGKIGGEDGADAVMEKWIGSAASPILHRHTHRLAPATLGYWH